MNSSKHFIYRIKRGGVIKHLFIVEWFCAEMMKVTVTENGG